MKSDANGSRILPLLILLLAGSGCAALIYEIVWLQLLQLVIGSSAVSLGLLLAAYMGGLCLGSAALPWLVSPRRHPLRVYAFLELGIGAFGILALFGLPLIGRLYLAGPTSGMAGLLARGVIAAVCLLPPTLLMGASFPAIARWAENSTKTLSWLGAFYCANIAGAVIGCLAAGFYLVRVYDIKARSETANDRTRDIGAIKRSEPGKRLRRIFRPTRDCWKRRAHQQRRRKQTDRGNDAARKQSGHT